jgi:hypothetical protein
MSTPLGPTVRVWTTNQEAPGKTTIPGFLGGTPIAVLAGFDLTSALFVVAQRPQADHWTRDAGLSSAGFLIASALLIGALAFAGRAQFVLITPDQAKSWWPELALNQTELRKIREVVYASQDHVDRLIKSASKGWLAGLWMTAAAFGLGAWSYGLQHTVLLVGGALAALILLAASWVFIGEEHLRPAPVHPLTTDAERLLHDDRFEDLASIPPTRTEGATMPADHPALPAGDNPPVASPAPANAGMLIIRTLGPLLLLSGIVFGVIRILSGDDHDRTGRALIFGSAVTLVVFLLLELVKPNNDVTRKRRQYGWTTVIFGADGRVSTSKTQVFLWTIGLAYAAAFLTGIQIFVRQGVFDNANWNDYLILLGGPFAAAVLAKYSVVTKLNAGTIAKSVTGTASPTAAGSLATSGTTKPSAADVVADDSGNLDLVDTQYFIFNVVAFAYAAGIFIAHNFDHTVTAQAGKYVLPTIPSVLLALTGASAATYVANKAAQKDAPAISSIHPDTGVHTDDVLTITGVNLVPATTPAESAASQTWVWISPNAGPAEQVGVTLATPTMVRFQMPPAYEGKTVQIIEVSAGAVPTAPYPVEVAPPPQAG